VYHKVLVQLSFSDDVDPAIRSLDLLVCQHATIGDLKSMLPFSDGWYEDKELVLGSTRFDFSDIYLDFMLNDEVQRNITLDPNGSQMLSGFVRHLLRSNAKQHRRAQSCRYGRR